LALAYPRIERPAHIGQRGGCMIADTNLSLLDGLIIAVLLAATGRGIWNGLIREGFSIAALGAAVLATRFFAADAATWLTAVTNDQIGSGAAPWICGALISIGTVGLVGTLGSLLRRGARFAGLGMADRLGGAALGAAEGMIVAMLIVLGATWTVGRAHPVVEQSRSLAAYDSVRSFVDARSDQLPDVASPGDW
jgi:uncharacterized membrane protein required for colicin V production